jgi:hypothetical protein
VMRRPTPEVHPASATECVQALLELVDSPDAPRWACVGWAVDLVGPWRSVGRPGDDGTSSREALEELLDRLRPEEARTEWPAWIGDRRDEVMLGVGLAVGRPEKRLVVDIPEVAGDLAVDIGGGWCGSGIPVGPEIR